MFLSYKQLLWKLAFKDQQSLQCQRYTYNNFISFFYLFIYRFRYSYQLVLLKLKDRIHFLLSTTIQNFEERRGRIAELFHNKELSVSTYDTAWVAMVPSPTSITEPCFPGCLNWLLENQCQDGSWARPHHHHLLKKDILSSTLACILALKKWGVGEEQINRGLFPPHINQTFM